MVRKAWMPALAMLASACANAEAPERVVEPRTNAAPAARGDALLRQAMLDRHNDARRVVGVAALAWDDALAADALVYARELARSGKLEHAKQPMSSDRQGENLFTGTRDGYDYAEMVQLWIDERKSFVNRPALEFSTTGDWTKVGHYTQIVWRTTTRVGCGLANNATDDYLVCRYFPAGNVIGLRAF